ncbi:XRE family transcriptional regulator [Pedobacter nutrimenti]|uniref:XRE family transcriptional regulator n=1 Tax=Pedobacter nutrimenti TaxID=1241337 RepID=UPI00292CDE67|nr:helix-turn-helix domain-containing protein [Pedobacter nutrimenti]
MNTPKIFFGSNLKFLRERKKMSQEELSFALEIKRSKLSAIENGQTKSPPFEDVINLSEYFKISIDSLLRIDLSRLGELKLRELEAGNDVYMMGGNLRVLAITVDKDNKENAEYVPIKAKAGYRAGLNDPEYVGTLPKFTLPNLPIGWTYRMFPTTGDSMLPIPEGSDVICRYIQDWGSIKPQTVCIVILKAEQDFVFKQVTLQNNGLLLESLNTQYQPYIVSVSDVLELWEFQRFVSETIPDISPDLQTIAKALREIQGDVTFIKEKSN